MSTTKDKHPIDAFNVSYHTSRGAMVQGLAEDVLKLPAARKFYGRVNLIFTSPPFPLNRKKKYGNEIGKAYIEWLGNFAPLFRKMLAPRGSIVLEVGNAWEPGLPVMSTLALRALLEFMSRGNLYLCQQFICYNPARLPSPAQWVNVERIRLKDAYTHLWWMSTTPRPQADNRRVLKPYSSSMERLLKNQKYNSGARPSEYQIGETSFLKNNSGAIPPNVLTISNTRSQDAYQKYCRYHNIQPHPARMPVELADFFIRFLTRPRNLVLDPFGGSNTTGAAAERLKRRWLVIEPQEDYIEGSKGRFSDFKLPLNLV